MAYTPVDWTKQTEKSTSGHTIPSAVKHKGEVYHYTGKHGTHLKSGQASHEYRSSDEKTDKRVWRTVDGKVLPESVSDYRGHLKDLKGSYKDLGRKITDGHRVKVAKEETEVTEDTFSQGRKEWGARMDKIIAAKKRKEEKEREAKKAKVRDQIAQGNKEYYATRKAMKNESEGLDELYVKDSEKAFELKSKIDRLKKTHAKHVATLASTPDTVANSEKRIDLGMKIDGLKRNIKKHVDAHKKLAPAEYHESVEKLDELKASTLRSYIAKGRRDADLGGMYAASGRTPRTPYEKKLQNRHKGAIKATMKLSRGDYQKEDVTELDELKKSTIQSYVKKAGSQIDRDFHANAPAIRKTGEVPAHIVKRYVNTQVAKKKLEKGDFQKESIEEAIKAGDFVSHQNKTYKVFKVDGTTLHVGQHYGDDRFGGSKMLHVSKVQKTTNKDVKESIKNAIESLRNI